jgi:hypothetical protein
VPAGFVLDFDIHRTLPPSKPWKRTTAVPLCSHQQHGTQSRIVPLLLREWCCQKRPCPPSPIKLPLTTQLYLITTSHFEHPTWRPCWPPDLTSHYISPRFAFSLCLLAIAPHCLRAYLQLRMNNTLNSSPTRRAGIGGLKPKPVITLFMPHRHLYQILLVSFRLFDCTVIVPARLA